MLFGILKIITLFNTLYLIVSDDKILYRVVHILIVVWKDSILFLVEI
jgi:hypothetical protein